MDLASAFPSADLLQQIDGIESGLRKGKALGIVGWGGLLVSGIQIPVMIARSGSIGVVRDFATGDLLDHWPLYLVAVLLLLSILLITFTRIWLKESEESFRYTYSTEPFTQVGAGEADPWIESLLPHDVSRRLSERIGRLSPLDEALFDSAETPDSHVHIAGDYVFRLADGRSVLEVMPRIRIGKRSNPQTLAHAVKFDLPPAPVGDVPAPAPAPAAAPVPPSAALAEPGSPLITEPSAEGSTEEEDTDEEEDDWIQEDEESGESFGLDPARSGKIDRAGYEMLLERVYFNVASEIYKQIRKDVQKRIDLLPGKRFKAAAYYHEAEDYARSNTLDAYDEAARLFRSSIDLYDPIKPYTGTSRIKRALHAVGTGVKKTATGFRRVWAKLFRGAAKRDVMTARAAMGYANMLVYRRVLAGLSGHRTNPIFEAGPAAQRAVDLFDKVPKRYPGRGDLAFDALVTLALVQAYAGPLAQSGRNIRRACEVRPGRVERDARYQFVAGVLEPSLQASLLMLRRAVELDPRFEVALFELADRSDLLWRRRGNLEGPESRLVSDLYRQVVELNPGNVQAWARLAHISWLLGQQTDAEELFRRGRYYKEIKEDTFVAALDYGLARIAAEKGDIATAFERYSAALGARIAQGVSHDPENSAHYYFFESSSEDMWRRFNTFKQAVSRAVKAKPSEGEPYPKRIRDSVLGFALNDFGEACHNRYFRTGEDTYLGFALDSYTRATELDPTNVMPHYNLCAAKLRASEFRSEEGRRIAILAERKLAGTEEQNAAASDQSAGRRLSERAAELLDESDRLLEDAVSHAAQVVRQEPCWADGQLLFVMAQSHRARIARSQVPRFKAIANSYRQKAQELDLRREQADEPQGLHTVEAPAYAASKGVTAPQDGAVVEIYETRGSRAWTDRQARFHERLVETNEQRAARLEVLAVTAAHEVTDRVKSLLPHPWLWKDERNQTFNWAALDPRTQLVWASDLDDLHVRVIATWARAQLVLDPEGGADDHVAQTLIGLHRSLVPDDLTVLTALREIKRRRERLGATNGRKHPAGEQELLDVDAGIRSLVLRGFKRNPGSFKTLCLVTDPSLDDDERLKVLEAASQEPLEPAVKEFVRAQRDRVNLSVGRRLWMEGDVDRAIKHLDEVHCETDPDGLWWRTDLVQELGRSLGEEGASDRLAHLKDWLEKQLLTTSTSEGRLDARNALVSLVRAQYEIAGRGIAVRQAARATSPEATVVALELNDAVFPGGISDPGLISFVKDGLTSMRDDVVEDTGVEIPEITLRLRSDLDPGGYALALHEAPVAAGTIRLDGYFCPDLDACTKLNLGGERTGKGLGPKGMWLDAGGRHRALEAGLEVLEPTDYILRDAEFCLRSNIAAFLGFQDVQQLVRRWAGESEARNRLVAEALPSTRHRFVLASALRSLALDGVPIVELGVILEAAKGCVGGSSSESIIEDAQKLVGAARLALRDSLPGNEPWRDRVPVPEQVIRRISRSVQKLDDKRFLALRSDVAQNAVDSIYASIGPARWRVTALVVRDSEMRPFLQRLVARGSHPMPVLARAELLSGPDGNGASGRRRPAAAVS